MAELTNEEKVVFGIAEDPQGKIVLLGVPEAAWEYMKDGKTHTFDLRSLGVPFRIILFGGKDRKAVIEALGPQPGALDLTGLNFGFGRQG